VYARAQQAFPLHRSLSDLLHLVALFAIIFAGYTVAGMALFGRQFEGFSTAPRACQTLLFILLCLDPTQLYVQVRPCTYARIFKHNTFWG